MMSVHTRPMAPLSYGEILARNIRAARNRLGIGQESAAVRMRALGFDAWIRQTVGATERGRRRPTAEEILGLALALETSVRALLEFPYDEAVAFPGGQLGAKSMERLVGGLNDKTVRWKDDAPEFTAGKAAWFAGDQDAPDVVKARWAAAEDDG
jgi:transcriptional regulator with XRE-family HTH domain